MGVRSDKRPHPAHELSHYSCYKQGCCREVPTGRLQDIPRKFCFKVWKTNNKFKFCDRQVLNATVRMFPYDGSSAVTLGIIVEEWGLLYSVCSGISLVLYTLSALPIVHTLVRGIVFLSLNFHVSPSKDF